MADISPMIDTWTASDGYVAHCRRYLPTERPHAHVICLHGIQSHGGWYEYSCKRLCEASFAVHYLDRRGSGLNQSDRGDAPSFRRLLDDLHEFISEFRTETPEIPIVLAACSWGGKLAPALCRRHPGTIDALVLLCPGILPKVRPAFGERMRILFSRLFRPSKLYPIPLSDPALFTDTPKWREFIARDPLALHQATARFLVESVRLDLYLKGVPRWVRVPVLLQLAELDRIIQNGPTRAFIERFASPDKQIIEYEAAHHTLEFEPDPNRFIDDWIAWMHARLPNLIRDRQRALAEPGEARLLNPGTCRSVSGRRAWSAETAAAPSPPAKGLSPTLRAGWRS